MKDAVRNGCAAWDLPIEEEALDRMDRFAQMLIEKNRVMNLTSVTDPKEIGKRHMLDCLYLLKCHEFSGKRIIDIGCGAGFPTMPLLCYDPALDITALDSTRKRIAFIESCCAQLGLPIYAVSARAEEQAKSKVFFETFDIVLSRAVASMNVLAELCLPYLSIGGVFLAQKSVSPETEEELTRAKRGISILGGEVEERYPYQITGLEREHQIIKIRKVAKTPPAYPRRFSKITSNPL